MRQSIKLSVISKVIIYFQGAYLNLQEIYTDVYSSSIFNELHPDLISWLIV